MTMYYFDKTLPLKVTTLGFRGLSNCDMSLWMLSLTEETYPENNREGLVGWLAEILSLLTGIFQLALLTHLSVS